MLPELKKYFQKSANITYLLREREETEKQVVNSVCQMQQRQNTATWSAASILAKKQHKRFVVFPQQHK